MQRLPGIVLVLSLTFSFPGFAEDLLPKPSEALTEWLWQLDTIMRTDSHVQRYSISGIFQVAVL